MRVFLKNAIVLSIAGLALLASMMAASRLSWQASSYTSDAGLMLAYQDDEVVVAGVASGGAGATNGIVEGGVVADLNGQPVLLLSPETKQAMVSANPPINTIWLIDRGQIPIAIEIIQGTYAGDAFPGQHYSFYTPPYTGPVDMWPVFLGLLILVGGWWLLRSGRAGEMLRAYSVTLPVATAMPLLLGPLDSYPSDYATAAEAVLIVAGTLPLGLQFASALSLRHERALARLGVLALGGAAFVFGVVWLGIHSFGYWVPLIDRYTVYAAFLPSPTYARFGAIALMSLVPGVLAARPLGLTRTAGNSEASEPADVSASERPHRFVQSADIALAALTPAVAAMSLLSGDHETWPIVLWLLGLFVARRFGIQPLLRLAQRTSRQRDLVVSATERERARIAGDIHDYALQDLTMLVRRLDAAGDQENAAAAREVADRLRAICGDLRLPILDDLGVGPALDWLVDRLEPDSTKLDLELFDREQRLTPDAELAFFRVAQEAIANAIHHATPPVMVRYWGGGNWAELIVDDCGSGIPNGAAEAAERSGHMGLMSMSQRAEAIGAELTLGRRPGGGARIHMTWERKAGEAERATDPVPAPSIEPSGPAGASPEPA